MGHQIIKQPDGRLAIFSTGTDTFIVADATAEEIVEYYADRAAHDARVSATETVKAVLEDRPRERYAQFVMTFDEANADSKTHGGSYLDENGKWVDQR